MEGESLREAAKLRWYTVTTEDARFGQYRLTRGLLGVIKMYLVLGFRYLSCRLKQGPLTGKEKLCQ
jgi:hypothetical protein